MSESQMPDSIKQELLRLCMEPGCLFWITKDGKYLLSANTQLWQKRYGPMSPITGKDVLERFTLEEIDECTEKCIVKIEAPNDAI